MKRERGLKRTLTFIEKKLTQRDLEFLFLFRLKVKKIIKGARTLTKGEGIRHKIMRFSLKGARELK